MLIGMMAWAAPVSSAFAAEAAEPIRAVRGLASMIDFRSEGPTLRATANQSRVSPVLVRIVEANRAADGKVAYKVEFIGLMAGEYDLRDYLERNDGSPVNLPSMPIAVESRLDASHGTDLFSAPRLPLFGAIPYRVLMIGLGVLWASVPVIYLIIRLVNRTPPPEPVPVVPPPTLAEQLQPLAEAAVRGTLSVREQARLELLMYLYWRDQLGLQGPQAEVVQRLRRDDRAGGLLRAVEGWLHSGRAPAGRVQEDVARLLDPYRQVQAITVNSVAAAGEGAQ